MAYTETRPRLLWAVLLGAAATTVTGASGQQLPLLSPQQESTSKWRFDVPPPLNGTSNFIFDTVSSLLQQWGNTHYRNGHNIVPATIPIGTLLYHGTPRKEVPKTPEWLATDPEHAYPFCRSWRGGESSEGCLQLVVAVSRPLNVLYFDGSSAAKLPGGLDIQDLINWGKVDDSKLFDEYVRITKLCEWGQQYNLDGFMRMEMDFEIMLCDFSAGVEIVSFEPLVRSAAGPGPGRPGQPFNPLGVIEAGHWHNHFPGETRAQLDFTRLVSLYDTDSFPSLVSERFQKGRWEHRVKGIDARDLHTMLEKLDENLKKPSGTSGLNWQSIYRVVIHRWADRLELIRYMLNAATGANGSEAEGQWSLQDIFAYVEGTLAPYTLFGVKPPSDEGTSLSWASPIFARCATLHTAFISRTTLTSSEDLLLTSVNEVLHEICRVTVGIWADGVGLCLSKKVPECDKQRSFDTGEVLQRWNLAMDGLVEWLDWSVWVKCRPACSFEEFCYIPTWPFIRNRPYFVDSTLVQPIGHWDKRWGPVPDFAVQDGHEAGDDDDWIRPQPRCMRRLAPFDVLY